MDGWADGMDAHRWMDGMLRCTLRGEGGVPIALLYSTLPACT